MQAAQASALLNNYFDDDDYGQAEPSNPGREISREEFMRMQAAKNSGGSGAVPVAVVTAPIDNDPWDLSTGWDDPAPPKQTVIQAPAETTIAVDRATGTPQAIEQTKTYQVVSNNPGVPDQVIQQRQVVTPAGGGMTPVARPQPQGMGGMLGGLANKRTAMVAGGGLAAMGAAALLNNYIQGKKQEEEVARQQAMYGM